MIKTVSLQTAKALKMSGFPQASTFYWEDNGKLEYGKSIFANCSALTSDELLKEMPEIVKFFIDCPGASLSIQFTSDRTYFCYYAKHLNHIAICHSELNESLPEALAQMWLWLKKENLLTNRKE